MAIPVFVNRPFPGQATRIRLEALIAAEDGQVVMEAETPLEGGKEIMLMAAFPDEAAADAFVGQAICLAGVTAEKEVSMRVAT
mgnify:CR=1 FL=1